MQGQFRHIVQTTIFLISGLLANQLWAGDVTIQRVVFEKQGASWTVETTLQHDDTGWQHYADAWRVVDEKGSVFATRTLLHPHVDEQPFTRSLSDIKIPANLTTVFVEAHDKVHGWSNEKIRVDLTKKQGRSFKVIR
jgi:hypothetical protein